MPVHSPTSEEGLGDTVQQSDVAADVRLHVEARDLRPEQETPNVRRHAEFDEAKLFNGVDDDDVAAAATDRHQRPHQARMVRRRIAADQKKKIAVLDVIEGDGGRAGAYRAAQGDGAGLMTVEGAGIDVVGPVQPGEQL